MNKNIAAVDPGKDKCGVAVLDMSGGIIYREVVMTDDLINILQSKKDLYHYDKLIIGNGTTSGRAGEKIKNVLSDVEVIVVDEYNTTQLAKQEYWNLCPPKGWRRFFPLGMQVPPVPVDDIVAVILGRRYLEDMN